MKASSIGVTLLVLVGLLFLNGCDLEPGIRACTDSSGSNCGDTLYASQLASAYYPEADANLPTLYYPMMALPLDTWEVVVSVDGYVGSLLGVNLGWQELYRGQISTNPFFEIIYVGHRLFAGGGDFRITVKNLRGDVVATRAFSIK